MDNQTLVETRGRRRIKDVATKLLHSLRTYFSTIEDSPRDERGKKKEFSLTDCLMSAQRIFVRLFREFLTSFKWIKL
jgi:hypothetical protein